MEFGAAYATSWSMFENGGSRQGTDFSLIDGKNMVPRASYWHSEFVSKYFKGNYLKGYSSNQNMLLYGANYDGSIRVMLMNRGDSTIDFTLKLTADTSISSLSIFSIDADDSREYKGSISGKSTQVLLIEKGKINRITYTSDDFLNERRPVTEKLDF